MSALSGKVHNKRSRPGMGFRSDGSPIVPWRLWRSVLRRFLRQPEPVAGIPGEGSGAGEQSAPAPYRLFPEPGDGVLEREAAYYWGKAGPMRRVTLGVTGEWRGPIPCDIPSRSIIFRDEQEGIGIPCATCGKRGTVRIKPRIYGCRHCLGLSLVAIGRMGTCGFAVYELRETPAEAAALQAAIARGGGCRGPG